MTQNNSSATGGLPPTALITGAAKRLGAAMALALAEDGFAIALHYHQSRKAAEELQAAIAAMGRRAVLIGGDLSAPNTAAKLWRDATTALGPIGVLINNAAIFTRDVTGAIDPLLFHQHMQINALSPLLLSQEMCRQTGPGCIIQMLDYTILQPKSGYASYGLSKQTLWQASKELAKSAPPGIRLNGLAPGIILPTIDAPATTDWRRAYTESPLPHAESVADIIAAMRQIVYNPALRGQLWTVDSGRHLRDRPIFKNSA
jgi:NAD(P)-dependent dehydrogenase (short-subunit alcohol dehydrogenase family)